METDTENRGLRSVEVLVVTMCVAALLALVLPACRPDSTPRATARRRMCTFNLRKIAEGLAKYHEIHGVYPMGAMHAGDPEDPRIGPSWWYATLPYIRERDVYDKIARTQTRGYEPGGVEFTYASMPDAEPDRIQTALRHVVSEYMRCPDSALPVLEHRSGRDESEHFIAMPSYVGIAGGCDINPDSPDYDLCPARPQTPDVYINEKKGTGPNGSIITSSGLLPPMEHIRMSDCTDGISNTMIVAEQSDWLRSIDANNRLRFRGDPGWNMHTALNPGGWLSGTNVVDPVGPAAPDDRPGSWRADLLFNLTTVRLTPQLKNVMRSAEHDALPGCAEVMGHNNPLQSAHPGCSIFAAFADGSVQSIGSNVDLGLLLRLAIRNDGYGVRVEYDNARTAGHHPKQGTPIYTILEARK